MKSHYLKTLPESFVPILRGKKSFDIRKNDRGFEVGDELVLLEWSPEQGSTGRILRRTVRYMMQGVFGLPAEICVMSITEPENRIGGGH